jgi:hypothetical protein
VNRLYDGVINLISLGDLGYNPRMYYFIDFFNNYSSWFGYGLNTYDLGGMRVWTVHMEIIYYFGFVGWSLFLILSIYTGIYLYKNNIKSFILYLSTFIYTSLNSSGGIIFSIIIYMFIIYFIQHLKFKKRRYYKNNIIISTSR